MSHSSNGGAVAKCLTSIPAGLPIAFGYVCKGESSSLLAPTSDAVPAKLSFGPAAVAACALQCATLSLFDVPATLFAAARPPVRLSSYWTPKAKGPPAGSYSFVSERGAIVGQVVGGAIRTLIHPCDSLANVLMCFPAPSYTLERADFTERDVATATTSDLAHLKPLELAVEVSDVYMTWCVTVPKIENDTVYVPVMRTSGWASAKARDLSQGAVISLIVTATGYAQCAHACFYVPHPAASCAVVTLLSVVAVVSLIIRRPRSFFMAMPFYLLILIGAATLIRAFYFASLATNNLPEQSTAQDVALIEIPTFLWFTAVTLIISFWAVLSSKRLYAFDVLRRVAVIFCVTNLIMYAIFIATIVAFAALQGSKQRCQGRLPPTTQRHQQRVLQTLYQAFLAAVALIIGTVFAFVSLRMLPRLNEAASAAGTQQIRSATYVGLLVAASFVAHAIYLLVLAVASPGVPQLALLVLLTEATPAAVLVAQMLVQWFHTPGGAGGQSGASSTDDGSDAQYFQHDNSDI